VDQHPEQDQNPDEIVLKTLEPDSNIKSGSG
jgi:hypothetical protein